MSIESVMLFNHLILCCPLLLPSIFPSSKVFSSESAFLIRWPKYWSFSINPSNEYSGLISFRIDWFGLPVVMRLSRVSFSTTFRKHVLYLLTIWIGKTMSLTVYINSKSLQCTHETEVFYVNYILIRRNKNYKQRESIFLWPKGRTQFGNVWSLFFFF